MNENFLRTEFNKRIKSLKLDEQAKEELYNKFRDCFDKGFPCFYCGRRMDLHFENEYSFSIDHTIPKAKNGKDEPNNLEFVCRTCNLLKGNRDAEKFENSMGWLIARKKRKEYWKARKSSKNDKRTRDAFKDIFERANANK